VSFVQACEESRSGVFHFLLHFEPQTGIKYLILFKEFCPSSWSISGNKCFRVDEQSRHNFNDYFQGRVCEPASGWKIADLHAIPNMADAVLDDALHGAYYGLYRESGSRVNQYS